MSPKNRAASPGQHAKPAQRPGSHVLQPKASAQRLTAPPVYRPQGVAPRTLQAKTAAAAQPVRGPVRPPAAPPVYRPLPTPAVLQKKVAAGRQPPPASPQRKAVAPPVYRPELKRVAQLKASGAAQAHKPPQASPHKTPQAPPVYRPQTQSPQPRPNAPAPINGRQIKAVQPKLARATQASVVAAQQLKASTGQARTGRPAGNTCQPFSRVIQRQVIFEEDEKGGYYRSDLSADKASRFKEREHAEHLDQVITELQRLKVEASKTMAQISRDDLARLQRIRSGQYNSWVPDHCRGDSTVVALQKEVCGAMQLKRKKLPPDPANFWKWSNQQWDAVAQVLSDEGFPQALDLAQHIKTGEAEHAAGYKFQLSEHLREFYEFKLVAIEPTYGVPKQSTGHKPRADSKTVEGFTQATPGHFYPVEDEQHAVHLTDYKVGYKNEAKVSGPFWQEFRQYGGVAQDGSSSSTYGGVHHTQSTPPRVDYQFYKDEAPPWISNGMEVEAQKVRQQNPHAFPLGLSLNQKQVLAPVEAKAFFRRVQNALFEDGVMAQLSCTSWEDWDGDFHSWKQYVLSLTNRWDTEADLPK
jgi:hypothetical protein